MAYINLEDVELGFAEKPEVPNKLTSSYFPSKIGGKPAWLHLLTLPHPEDLFCEKCNKPRVFLLQVYAPIGHLPHCYHRTLFVFCCKEPSCHTRNCNKSFLVLRCNLPQANSFYTAESSEILNGDIHKKALNVDKLVEKAGLAKSDTTQIVHPLVQEDFQDENVTHGINTSLCMSDANSTGSLKVEETTMGGQHQAEAVKCISKLPPLCVVCGCSGPKRCAKCQCVNYCSREHQVIHWKAGHKRYCGNEKLPTSGGAEDGGLLFEEFEIITEPEPPIKTTPEKSEAERMKVYHEFVKMNPEKLEAVKMDNLTLDDVEKGVKKDKQFLSFKKRIAVEPDQVIRYQRGGEPLWISRENMADKIPNCERCGSRRVFEFQVMPQLLYHLKLDSTANHSIDWGMLAVYSCESSCDSGPDGVFYQPEFLWKQDPSI